MDHDRTDVGSFYNTARSKHERRRSSRLRLANLVVDVSTRWTRERTRGRRAGRKAASPRVAYERSRRRLGPKNRALAVCLLDRARAWFHFRLCGASRREEADSRLEEEWPARWERLSPNAKEVFVDGEARLRWEKNVRPGRAYWHGRAFAIEGRVQKVLVEERAPDVLRGP